MEINNILELKNSKEWIEFDKYYNYSSFMKKVGFYKFEDPNTNFLASLLKENFEDTNFSLRLLIELLSQKSNCFDKLNLLSDYEIIVREIRTRKSIKRLKPDLLLRLSINKIEYVIIIEAKLNNLESPNQCKKYEKIINEEYPNSVKKIYVFLDRDKKNNISSDFIRLTYCDLLNSIYTPCIYKIENQELKQQLKEYIRSFVEFYTYNDMDYEYIPLSYEGKELTFNLWNKHNEVLNELFNNHEILNEFYKANNVSLRAFIINSIILYKELKISETLRNKLKYLLNRTNETNLFNGIPYNNVKFVYELFKDITTNPKIDVNKIEDIPDSIITINNWQLIVANKDIDSIPSSRKDYYRLRLKNSNEVPITLNDQEYLYCTFINGNDIEQLIEAVIESFPYYEGKIERTFKLYK